MMWASTELSVHDAPLPPDRGALAATSGFATDNLTWFNRSKLVAFQSFSLRGFHGWSTANREIGRFIADGSRGADILGRLREKHA
jgi:hypothetical protein